MSEHDYLRADSLQRLLHEEGSDTLRYKLLQAVKTNDVARRDKLLAVYRQKHAGSVIATQDLLDFGDFETAAALSQGSIDPARPAPAIAAAHVSRGTVSMEQGRIREGFQHLAQAGKGMDYTSRKVDWAVLPFVQLDASQIAALRAEVLRSDSAQTDKSDPREQLLGHFRLYSLGLLSCIDRKPADALRYAQQIESAATPEYWKPAMHALATYVRALADVAGGHDKEALAKLESVGMDAPFDLFQTPAMRQSQLIWRAELLYRAGRDDDALAWLENLPDGMFAADAGRTYALLRRAQIHDRRGEGKEASALYAQVLKNWKDADASLRPSVEQARTRLAALQEH